jgi:hypothetical protein
MSGLGLADILYCIWIVWEYWILNIEYIDFCGRMIWLLSHPLAPLSSASWLSFSDFLCVAGWPYWREWKGGGGGQGAKSYNREKAWLSINHSILSVESPTETYARTIVADGFSIFRVPPIFHWKKCIVPVSVADPWHFGVDPDPAIFVIDLQDAKKKQILKKFFCFLW